MRTPDITPRATVRSVAELEHRLTERHKNAEDRIEALEERCKSFSPSATRHDLHEMEKRLLSAIKGNRPLRVRFDWAVGPVQPKALIRQRMDIKITNEQQVRVKLSPKTDSGKPASLDGSPAWTVVSGNSQVVVDDNGLGATLVSSDDPGDTEVLVKADADLGEGVEEISDVIKLSVIGATAKNLGLTAEAPTQK